MCGELRFVSGRTFESLWPEMENRNYNKTNDLINCCTICSTIILH
jgi:hypothetical protein